MKIACIGCSWTEGVKLADNYSWPFLLYTKIKQNTNKEISLYNCGIGGSGTKLHKYIFEFLKQEIKPDIIIHQITSPYRIELLNPFHGRPDNLENAFCFSNDPNSDSLFEGHGYKKDFYVPYGKNNFLGEKKTYYQIAIDPKSWLAYPLVYNRNETYDSPLKPKNPFSKENYEEFITSKKLEKYDWEKIYMDYVKPSNTMTYQQFKTFFLYKTVFERFSTGKWLEYYSDIDYILNSTSNTFSFFWVKEDREKYDSFKEKTNEKTFKGTDMESVFELKNKKLENYCVDDMRHPNTKGNEIVADWVFDQLKFKGKI